ncbi:MAG: sulfatase [Chthoniobacteraceae bacterium]
MRFLLRFVLFVSFVVNLRAAELPNVVVIFCDDLGYGDIGPFGAKGYATPNLDRMAAEGRKFTRFYVSSPVCSASRAALLTGCYHGRVGVHGAFGPGSPNGLHPDEMTIAEVLKPKGYTTCAVGKWHLGRPAEFLPTRQGFDEYLGLPYSNDMWPHHPEAKPGAYPKLPLIDGEKVIDEEVTPADQTKLTAIYTGRAVDFIKRSAKKPFFLYLAHSMVHVPLFVGEKFKGKTGSLFGDVMEEVDWSVGEILRTLKEQAIDEKTLVVFTSDNGPWLSYGDHCGNAGPLREGKGTCWEGGVRVPCVMRWPGRIAAGTATDEALGTIDLLPTIAKLAGADLPPRKIDGKDGWPLISGAPGAKSPQEAYFFYYANNQLQALASGRWKLQLPHAYRTLGGKSGGTGGIPAKYTDAKITEAELYDLQSDTGEKTNVAAKNPAELSRLLVIAQTMRAELGDSLTKTQSTAAREPGKATPVK